MAKFLLTYSERWAVTYEVEAINIDAAWECDLDDATELRREIVAHECAMVELMRHDP